jgi:hypothetical protein
MESKANLASASITGHHVFNQIGLSRNGIIAVVMTTLDGQEIAIYDPGRKFHASPPLAGRRRCVCSIQRRYLHT